MSMHDGCKTVSDWTVTYFLSKPSHIRELLQKEIDKSFAKGKRFHSRQIDQWHLNYEIQKQAIDFRYQLIKRDISMYHIDIRGLYKNENKSFAKVSSADIPETVCFDILNHILGFARANKVIQSTGVVVNMFYYDASARCSRFIGTEKENALYKCWELTFDNVSQESLEIIVSELNTIAPFEGTPIRVEQYEWNGGVNALQNN